MMEGRFRFKYTHDSIIIEEKRKRINIIQHVIFLLKKDTSLLVIILSITILRPLSFP